jgi:hypothetical protein
MENERRGKARTVKISVPGGVSSDTRTCFSPTIVSSSEKLQVTPETGRNETSRSPLNPVNQLVNRQNRVKLDAEGARGGDIHLHK